MTNQRPDVLKRLRALFVGAALFAAISVQLVAQDPFGAAYGVACGAYAAALYSPSPPPPSGTVSEPAAATEPASTPASTAAEPAATAPTSSLSKFGAGGRSRAKSSATSPDWRHWWANNSESWIKTRAHIRDITLRRADGAGTDSLRGFDPIGPSRARREIVPHLQQALVSREPAMRAAAAVACGRIGGPGDDALRQSLTLLLADPLLDVQASTLLGLGFQGHEESIPLLAAIASDSGLGRQMLRQPDGVPTQLRSVACTALAMTVARTKSPLADGVAALLMRIALSDIPSMDLRGSAVLATGLVGDDSIVPQLVALARNETAERSLRANACTVLAKLGGASAVPVLAEITRSGSALLAPAAAAGLGIACAPGDETALRTLITAASSSDRAMLSAAIAALGETRSPRGMAALESIVLKGDNFASAQAAISLALALGTTANGKQLEILAAALKACGNQEDRPAFTLALAIAHHPDAAAEIESVLNKKNPDRELAWHHCTAAGVLGDRRLLESLSPWVRQSRDPALRQKASQAIATMHGEALLPDLLEVLAESRSNQTSLFATLGAIATIGDARAIAPLTQLLNKDAGLPELSRAAVLSAFGLLADKDSEPLLQRWRHGVQPAAAGAVVRSLLRVH